MNKYLEQLVNLSQIDKKIDSYAPRIEAINKDLNAKKEEIALKADKINSIDNEIVELKAQILSTNAHIIEFNLKIKDVSKKSGSAKTEREVKALNLEEDLAKDQLEAANEEITRLERIIESKEVLKGELQTNQNDLESSLSEIEDKVGLEMVGIEKERSEIYSQKDTLLSQMNQKMLTFYGKIRKWAKNTSVVPVKKQACYGCFMKINDKTFANVFKGSDIITCPHCGRILYVEDNN